MGVPSPMRRSHPIYVAEAFLPDPYLISPHNFSYTILVTTTHKAHYAHINSPFDSGSSKTPGLQSIRKGSR